MVTFLISQDPVTQVAERSNIPFHSLYEDSSILSVSIIVSNKHMNSKVPFSILIDNRRQ